MKKLLSLLALTLLLSLGIYASNTKPISNAHISDVNGQKQSKGKVENKVKYDFSLFKFITPSNTKNESDTLTPVNQNVKKKEVFNTETTELYEKPRTFLMFS